MRKFVRRHGGVLTATPVVVLSLVVGLGVATWQAIRAHGQAARAEAENAWAAVTLRIAMRALAANKLRSILTMLGIIIGVGAVIALMSLGRGVEKFVTDQFAGLGSNLLFITPGQISDGPPSVRQGQVKLLTLPDMNALLESGRAPEVKDVSGVYQGSGQVERNGQKIGPSCSTTRSPREDIGNTYVV